MYRERMYRAILGEFVPEWQDAFLHLTRQQFVDLWRERTGESRASGYRWYDRAGDLISGEFQSAA